MNDFTLKIDSDIPMPHVGKNPSVADTMRAMKVGDSVLLLCSISTAYSHGHTHFGKGGYITRKDGEGVRVWRTK